MTEESLLIIPASPKDLDEILAIEQVSFKSPFSENLIRMEFKLDIAHFYVARVKGRLVGYMDFWWVRPEIHLINIAVHPECRRKGIGRDMMQYLLAEARVMEASLITLDVRVSNRPAIALYEEFQFETAGLRKEYYGDGESALVMKRVL